MKEHLNRRSGFTLFEFIGVAIIIAGVLFFLLPQFLSIGNSVEASTCQSNRQTLSKTYTAAKALYSKDAAAAPDKVAWLLTTPFAKDKDVHCPAGKNPTYIINDRSTGLSITCPAHGDHTY